MWRGLLAVSVIGAGALAGCDDSRTPTTSGRRTTNPDASQPAPDAGVGLDFGVGVDFGVGLDFGVRVDSGEDGGTTSDSGAGDDATVARRDATPNPDASTPRDAGFRDAAIVGDPYDPATAIRRYAEANCARIARCSPYTFAFYEQTQQGCVQDIVTDTGAIWRAYADSRAAGRLGFDALKLDLCVDALRNGDCITDTFAPCGEIFFGTGAMGDGCAFQNECTAQSQCVGTGLCGTCQPRPRMGQPCPGGLCAPGLACVSGASGASCVPSGVASGGNCGPGVGACAGELQCVMGRCTPPAVLDQPCDPTLATRPDCDTGRGFACYPATNMCVQLSLVGLNAACTGFNQCNHLGACDAAQRVCVPRPTDGQPCTSRGTCADDHFCQANTCRAFRSQGASCSAAGARECELGLGCRGQPLQCLPPTFTLCPP